MPVGIKTNNIQEELKMKKLLVVLLSLGLIVAFGATASAQPTVKFGGGYYVVGVYEDNNALRGGSDKTVSRAFFYQRVRLQPVFQIAEGLSFTTRVDALEKQWGQTDWRTGVDDRTNSRREMGNAGVRTTTTAAPYATGALYGGNPKIQENIEFERAIVSFKTAIGVFDVGYQSSGKWGTDFGDDENSRPRIKFATQMGPLTLLAIYEKTFESDTSMNVGAAGLTSTTGLNTTTGAVTYPYQGKVDADDSSIALAAIYNFTGGNTGFLYKYAYNNSNRVLANSSQYAHIMAPYVKATFGPVYIEAEVNYIIGKAAKQDTAGVPDVDFDRLGAYIKGQANMGPAYFGALYLYSSGDDGTDPTKFKTGPVTTDMNPALIMANDELGTWLNAGTVQLSKYGAGLSSGKTNLHMIQAFGGLNPSPKLNMEVSFTTGRADKKPATFVSDVYGMEFDAKASYKIYDNLTYMVGMGYLWTGDYFKGTNSANAVGSDYLLMNRLTLSF
jgi:hypothetical protein